MLPGEIYLRSAPWLLPVVLLSALLLAMGARMLGVRHPLLVWATAMSLVIFFSATVTPSGGWRPWGAGWNVGWSYSVPSLVDLTTVGEPVINMLIAVPMSVCCAIWAVRSSRPSFALIPFGIALLAEFVQMAVPPLGRSGLLVSDVINTWIGCLVGVAVGAWVGRSLRPAAALHVPLNGHDKDL